MFIVDRLLFYRERGAAAYSTTAHWVATFASSLPLACLNMTAFCTLLYFMAGLNTASPSLFLYFLLTLLLCNMVALRSVRVLL